VLVPFRSTYFLEMVGGTQHVGILMEIFLRIQRKKLN
jgi:hypothetical protein